MTAVIKQGTPGGWHVIAKRAGRDAKTGETFAAGTPMIFTEAGWCIAPVAITGKWSD